MNNDIRLRPLTTGDLAALYALPFSGGLKSKHDDRLARQDRGEVIYLAAEDDTGILGHLLLKWNCPDDAALRAKTGVTAEIEDFTVHGERRGQGIGSAMLEEAARLAREHGETQLGLGVGIGNPGARSLYERVGFVLVPESEHTVTWPYRDAEGIERTESDDCVYLVKDLA